MAKYNIGQKVRVCDIEKMNQLQLKDAHHYDIVPKLYQYVNKVLTIEEMSISGESVFYDVEETHWQFHEDLLLPVDNEIVQNKRKDKFEYTVFDKVRVKSVEELESYNEIDSELYDITGSMFDLAGNVYTIDDTVVIDGEPFYYLEEDEDVWCWHQDLLELVEEDKVPDTVHEDTDNAPYKVGQKVRICSAEKMHELDELDDVYDVVSPMLMFEDKEVTIAKVRYKENDDCYCYHMEEISWSWHQDLLELVEEEPEYKTVNLEDINFGLMMGMGTTVNDNLDCFEAKKRQDALDFSDVMDKIDEVANKVHEIKALIKELEDEGFDVQFDEQTVGTKVGTRFYGRDLTMENDVE